MPLNNSSLPSRTKPLAPGCGRRRFPTEDKALAGIGDSQVAYGCDRCEGWHRKPRPKSTSQRRAQIAPVSAKRRRENADRRAMVEQLWPGGERPLCVARRPGCTRWADDLHEPLTRARGGSITNPDNAKPLCRHCHDLVTFAPESELGWAYDLGLLKHSWEASPDGS